MIQACLSVITYWQYPSKNKPMLFSKFLTSLFLVCLLWGFSNQSIAQLTPLYPSLKVINQVSIYPSYTDSTVQVFLFYSPDCPICKAFVPYIRQIKQQFERQGVQFALILPQSLRYKLSEIRKHELIRQPTGFVFCIL